MLGLIGSVVVVAALGNASNPPPYCYDAAIVARLDKQTYIGPVPVGPEEISLDGVFEWDARVRQVVVGEDVPRRLRFKLIAHTQLVRWAANQAVVFFRNEQDGGVRVVAWSTIPQGLRKGAWAEEVLSRAAEMELVACAQQR